jgi:AcrR family transcriptional regulator
LDPEQQRGLKLDALYQAASAEFRRSGYHGTSVTDIAEQLGVSKATLYYYVKNKQDLLHQCHLAAADQAIAAVCDTKGLSGIDRLRRSIVAYTTSIICETSFSVVILEERSLSPEQLAGVIEKRNEFERRLQAIVRDGIADGSIVPCDPKFAVFCVLGAANWVTKWYRPEGQWTVAEIAEGVAQMLCGGLATEGAEYAAQGTRLYGEVEPPKRSKRAKRGTTAAA